MTLYQPFQDILDGNPLIAIPNMWFDLFPLGLEYIGVLVGMGILYNMLADKMGSLIPTILLVITYLSLNFIILPWDSERLLYGIVVLVFTHVLVGLFKRR